MAENNETGGGTPGEPLGAVGLGNMGGAMVERLVAEGVKVIGFDLSAERRAWAESIGAETVSSLGALMQRCRVIMLSLPEGRHVRAVVEGPGGILEAGQAGTLVIDATTSEAETSRDLSAKLKAAGHAFLDAPVSGGPAGGRAGTLAIMVGGEAADLERARPYLDKIAGNLVHVGASGAGNVAKLVNNLLAATHMAVAAEAVRLAEDAGVDADALLDVVNSASGMSRSTGMIIPAVLANGRTDGGYGFSAGLMRKDVRLAMELAASTGTTMRFGEVTKAVWHGSRAVVADEDDFSRLAGSIITDGHPDLTT